MNKNKKTPGANKQSKLQWEIRQIFGKVRRGSSLTRADKLNCLNKIALCFQRYGIQSVRHAKPNHIKRLFTELQAAGLSAGRLANYATVVRALCQTIGKSDIVPGNRELGCNRDMANRTKHADERLNVVKAAEVHSRLSENNKIAYDMARQFGLRQKETLLSHKTVNRNGADYLIVEGAKGGRPRQVPITTQEQRDVLARNHAYRTAHDGKLIDVEKNLKQGIRQLQNDIAAAGANRNSGANMHTLRREWIIERCEKIAALPESLRQEKLNELVESIGHGRLEVLRSYTLILTKP